MICKKTLIYNHNDTKFDGEPSFIELSIGFKHLQAHSISVS